MDKEQILKKIEDLKYERMGYLEANNKAGARRKEKKIKELEMQLELSKMQELKEDLKLYKKFISKRGLVAEFQSFMIIELAKQ